MTSTEHMTRWMRALSYSKAARTKTLIDILDSEISFAGLPALIELRGTPHVMTYGGLTRQINRYARWALEQGHKPGDVVGLLMHNRIDYVALWLGLTRIGCTVALLNTNLRGNALEHCIVTAGCKTLIVGTGFPVDFLYLLPEIEHLWRWDTFTIESSDEDLANVPFPKPSDRALLIYTSGTTGMPKATIITHRRITEWSLWFAGMMDTQQSDCLYNCLPMYHSIGGVVAIGAMLVKGGSVFIRERFSVSNFWDDIAEHHCTIFQYIGELCRYLTLSPPHPKERSHALRLACGNGLQGDVWPMFKDRFAIPHVLEFYAATEGNLALYNTLEQPGAIGQIPLFLAEQYAVEIVKCDLETGVPVRTDDGLCVLCGHDEPGEAISRIGERQFDGYTDAVASEKKILTNVVTQGDRWFRSGDLMRRDARRHFYFIDRLGDTFRWKGENVSTTEVAAVIRGADGVQDVVVYGVAIQGYDGRAGMAAITTTPQFTFASLSRQLRMHLPDYAQPVFVRICDSLNVTGTFKLTKTALVHDGLQTGTDSLWKRNQNGDFERVT